MTNSESAPQLSSALTALKEANRLVLDFEHQALADGRPIDIFFPLIRNNIVTQIKYLELLMMRHEDAAARLTAPSSYQRYLDGE